MSDNESKLSKHSIVIAGHQTSVTLEGIFWDQLKIIARSRGVTLGKLIAKIDADRDTNLSSATRVFILKSLLEEKRRYPEKPD